MFKKNDIIIVSGFKLTENGKIPRARIAMVIEVGLNDLIVELMDDFLKRHIILSKSVCFKIPEEKLNIPQKRPIPEIGDLVMNYCYRFNNKKGHQKIIGHVVELEFDCNGESWAYILSNNKTEKYRLDDVIILEKIENN